LAEAALEAEAEAAALERDTVLPAAEDAGGLEVTAGEAAEVTGGAAAEVVAPAAEVVTGGGGAPPVVAGGGPPGVAADDEGFWPTHEVSEPPLTVKAADCATWPLLSRRLRPRELP